MEKNEMLSKEKMETALQTGMSQYLQTFYNGNFQNKLSEELVTGMGVKIIPEILKILDPWISKDEKETKEV